MKGFKKGYDPRRFVPKNHGLTEYRKTLAELMKDDAHKAVDFMFELLSDEKAGQRLRFEVAKDVCDRFYGKAVDRVSIQQINADNSLSVDEIDSSELTRMIDQLSTDMNNNPPIEGTVTRRRKEKVIKPKT